MLTQARVRELFDYRDGRLYWRVRRHRKRPGDEAGAAHNQGYRQVTFDGRTHLVHRLVWLWHTGALPEIVDHINRNRTDNRIENLRAASPTQSQGNRSGWTRRATTSRWKGVYWRADRRKWTARIHVNGRLKSLGLFAVEADAAMAYNEAAYEYFGEFAWLNDVASSMAC